MMACINKPVEKTANEVFAAALDILLPDDDDGPRA
jgi:hypothetical protein